MFKTLKYHPIFAERFGSLEDGRSYFGPFFDQYNNVHRHSGIGMLTPAAVHTGRANAVLDARHATMRAAFVANPLRFAVGEPKRMALPHAVWINQPSDDGVAA
jgi:putative transposase